MSEIVNEQVVEPDEVAEEVKPNPIEERARADNWRPKEEWVANGGDPDKWKDAATFVRDGEFFAKIDSYKKQAYKAEQAARQAQAEVNVIKGHYSKVEEAATKRLLDNLKSAKKQALIDGDADKVVEIDDQMQQLHTTKAVQAQVAVQQQQVQRQQAAQPTPEFMDWIEENQWYRTDPVLQEQADGLGIAHAQRNPSKTPAEILTYVEGQIKKLNPDKFTNRNRSQPSRVEGNSSPSARSSSSDSDSSWMTSEEIQVMKVLTKAKDRDGKPFLTEAQYKKDLKDKFYSRG